MRLCNIFDWGRKIKKVGKRYFICFLYDKCRLFIGGAGAMGIVCL